MNLSSSNTQQEYKQEKSWKDVFFKNDKSTVAFQLIIAFISGLILSPWSWGFFYFLLFLIGYEILLSWGSQCQSPYWDLQTRILVVIVSLLGFIIGRTLAGHSDPLKSKNSGKF